jgi:GntR family transcriptional regulator, rspAB operon transcriptional repressor
MPSALGEKLYKLLLQDFLSGKLPPGLIINRRKIAADYNVSVTPVLEAVTMLELEGFLETIPRKGTQIKPITQQNITGNFILRDAVESKAARIYFGETIEKNLDHLLEFAERVNSASEDNLDDWKLEITFHHELVALAGYPVLTGTYDRIMQLYLFHGMNQLIPKNSKTPRDDHVLLINNLLNAESANTAEKIIRDHVWYGKTYLLKGLI